MYPNNLKYRAHAQNDGKKSCTVDTRHGDRRYQNIRDIEIEQISLRFPH